MSVGGDLKFSPYVQDLKGKGKQGSKRWHRLAYVIHFFVFLSSFNRFASGLSLSSPILSFPVGSQGEGGKEI